MRYSFDQFELDTEHFLLQANAAEIHVEPLVFDLLSFLVERSGQVVSRAAIIENVWKGRFVSDATVSSCIKSVRRALGDSGQAQTYLRTIRGRGFQFASPVERVSSAFETPPAGEANWNRSEEHTSELQSLRHLVCRLLLEKKKKKQFNTMQPKQTRCHAQYTYRTERDYCEQMCDLVRTSCVQCITGIRGPRSREERRDITR